MVSDSGFADSCPLCFSFLTIIINALFFVKTLFFPKIQLKFIQRQRMESFILKVLKMNDLCKSSIDSL